MKAIERVLDEVRRFLFVNIFLAGEEYENLQALDSVEEYLGWKMEQSEEDFSGLPGQPAKEIFPFTSFLRTQMETFSCWGIDFEVEVLSGNGERQVSATIDCRGNKFFAELRDYPRIHWEIKERGGLLYDSEVIKAAEELYDKTYPSPTPE